MGRAPPNSARLPEFAWDRSRREVRSRKQGPCSTRPAARRPAPRAPTPRPIRSKPDRIAHFLCRQRSTEPFDPTPRTRAITVDARHGHAPPPCEAPATPLSVPADRRIARRARNSGAPPGTPRPPRVTSLDGREYPCLQNRIPKGPALCSSSIESHRPPGVNARPRDPELLAPADPGTPPTRDRPGPVPRMHPRSTLPEPVVSASRVARAPRTTGRLPEAGSAAAQPSAPRRSNPQSLSARRSTERSKLLAQRNPPRRARR